MLNNTAKLARFRQQMCQILGQRANSKMEVNAQIYAPAFAVAERYLEELMAQEIVAAVDPAVAARLFASPVLESLPIPSVT